MRHFVSLLGADVVTLAYLYEVPETHRLQPELWQTEFLAACILLGVMFAAMEMVLTVGIRTYRLWTVSD